MIPHHTSVHMKKALIATTRHGGVALAVLVLLAQSLQDHRSQNDSNNTFLDLFLAQRRRWAGVRRRERWMGCGVARWGAGGEVL